MERVKRALKTDHDKAVAAGGTTDYDEKRLWNLVWARATSDETFWREEVVEPCMLIITRITSPSEVVEGDAQGSSNQRETAPGPARMASSSERLAARPRNSNRTGRVHNIDNGKYTHNRTGYSICSGFNSGQCAKSTQGWAIIQAPNVHNLSCRLQRSSRMPKVERAGASLAALAERANALLTFSSKMSACLQQTEETNGELLELLVCGTGKKREKTLSFCTSKCGFAQPSSGNRKNIS